MRGRRGVVVLALFIGAAAAPFGDRPVSGADQGPAKTRATEGGTLIAELWVSGGGSGSGGSSCGWARGVVGPGMPREIVVQVGDKPDGPEWENAELWLRSCPSGANWVWVPEIDWGQLAGAAAASARAQLPLPVPDINPDPVDGGIVNLGLWIAVDDPGETTARAAIGPYWVEVTGAFSALSFDPGDGSGQVECEGLGVAYVDGSNDPDEGPCGHTYRKRTPAESPYRLSVTNSFDIVWRSSDGQSGSLGVVDRTVTFDYDVNEIQTVGTD